MNKDKKKEIIIFSLIGIAFIASLIITISGKAGGSSSVIKDPTPSVKATPTPRVTSTPVLSKEEKLEFDMQNEAYKVSSGMAFYLDSLEKTDPLEAVIELDSKTSIWSIKGKAKTMTFDKLKSGNTVSGTINKDGSYCVQIDNPLATSSWMADSKTKDPVKGECPN